MLAVNVPWKLPFANLAKAAIPTTSGPDTNIGGYKK